MDLFLLTILSLNFYRPSLLAGYAPSDTPEPLFTSTLCGYRCLHRYRQILTSGEGILALRSSVTPTCSYQPTPAPPTSSSFQRSMVCRIWDVIWSLYALCVMRWIAPCTTRASLSLMSLCACYHGIAAAMAYSVGSQANTWAALGLSAILDLA